MNTEINKALKTLLSLTITLTSAKKNLIILLRIAFTLNLLTKKEDGRITRNKAIEAQLNVPTLVEGSKEENRLTIIVR